MEEPHSDKSVFIMDYDDFKKIPPQLRHNLRNEEHFELQINISPEKLKSLTANEKKELAGVTVVHKDTETFKKNLTPTDRTFTLKNFLPEISKAAPKISYRDKHYKQTKPHVPLKIGIINTKKRGGR